MTRLRSVYDGLVHHESVRAESSANCGMMFDGAVAFPTTNPTSRIDEFHQWMDHAHVCAMGRSVRGDQTDMDVVFVGKTPDDMPAIRSTWERRVAAMAREVPPPDALSKSERAHREAHRTAMLRALRTASVQIDGTRMVARVTVVPDERERRASEPLLRERTERLRLLAKRWRDDLAASPSR